MIARTSPSSPARAVLRDRRGDPEHPRHAGAIQHVPGQPRDLALAHARAEAPGDEVPDSFVADVLQQRLDLATLEEAAAHVVHWKGRAIRNEVFREERGRLARRDVERSPQGMDFAVDRGGRLLRVEPLPLVALERGGRHVHGGATVDEVAHGLQVAADLVGGRPALVLHVHEQRVCELVHRRALRRRSAEALGARLAESLPELLLGCSRGLAAGLAVLAATDAVLNPVARGALAVVDAAVSAGAHDTTGCAVLTRVVKDHRSVRLRFHRSSARESNTTRRPILSAKGSSEACR